MLLSLMILLLVANGTPIIVRRLVGERLSHTIDAGHTLSDGQPIFGHSKTWLGLISAISVTILAAMALDFSILIGFLIGSGAMLGDLLSSFTKRRLGIAPSDMAFFLDQVPESLLPLLLIAAPLDLTFWQVAGLTVIFIILELLLSKILFHLHIRKRPY